MAIATFVTETVLAVWKNGSSRATTAASTIDRELMPPTQTQNYFTIGPANYPFEEQEPFTVLIG